MPNFSMAVPYATHSLPGLRGSPLGITDGRITEILAGQQLGGLTGVGLGVFAASALVTAAGAFIGARNKRGSAGAAAGALVGFVSSSLVGGMIMNRAIETEYDRMVAAERG